MNNNYNTNINHNTVNLGKQKYLIRDYIEIWPELKDLLPELSEPEYIEIKEDIRQNGFKVASGGKIFVWFYDDNMGEDADLNTIPPHVIVDGHHRLKACQELYEETGDSKYLLDNDCFEITYFDDIKAAKVWMIDQQLKRRNLSKYAMFEVLYANIDALREQARKNMLAGKKLLANLPEGEADRKISVRDELAKMVGIGSRTIGKFMVVADSNNEEIKNQLRKAIISADAACKAVTKKSKEANAADYKKQNIGDENSSVEETTEDNSPAVSNNGGFAATDSDINPHSDDNSSEKNDDANTTAISLTELQELYDEIDRLKAENALIKRQLPQFKLRLTDEGRIVPIEETETCEVAEGEVIEVTIDTVVTEGKPEIAVTDTEEVSSKSVDEVDALESAVLVETLLEDEPMGNSQEEFWEMFIKPVNTEAANLIVGEDNNVSELRQQIDEIQRNTVPAVKDFIMDKLKILEEGGNTTADNLAKLLDEARVKEFFALPDKDAASNNYSQMQYLINKADSLHMDGLKKIVDDFNHGGFQNMRSMKQSDLSDLTAAITMEKNKQNQRRFKEELPVAS